MRVLVTAPEISLLAVGEGWTAARLLQEMGKSIDLTILALEVNHVVPIQEQLPDSRVITFARSNRGFGGDRFRAMIKPEIFDFNAQCAKWLRETGERFDLAHQILPAAPRYPTVLRHFDMPYVIGSLGGALPTPPAFREETGGARWFTRLRALDRLRFRFDPWLRASYAQADLVLGVAPYMREVLAAVPIRRFEPVLGIGVDDLAPPVARDSGPGTLRLIHVGRVVRTKGLRDSIRALGHLPDLPGVSLTAIGDGEDLTRCRAEAEQLNLGDRVRFLGKLKRDEIEDHYREADALIFPSFRESMGAVLYEAMRWGLPVITVGVGGPDYIVDQASGLKVPLTDPEQMPKDLASAIRTLAADPELRRRMGAAGQARLEAEALWPAKARHMIELYQSVLDARAA